MAELSPSVASSASSADGNVAGCRTRPSILLLGEAWGGNEYETRKPFVGEAGKELFLALGEACQQLPRNSMRKLSAIPLRQRLASGARTVA